MQVGTTKDQGLYNKPSVAVHPGALATGTLPQYNIKKNNMGLACCTQGGRKIVHRVFVRKTERKGPVGRSKHRRG